MSRRDEFINSLYAYELAFLYKYKFDTYMKDTQEFIRGVMLSNGINENAVDTLIEESNESAQEHNLGGCPRCHSNKFFYFDTDYDNMSRSVAMWDNERFSGKMIKETNQECAVCGYSSKMEASEGHSKNHTIKYVLIALGVMYALARALMWAFDL